MSKYCMFCGEEISANAQFCQSCGQKQESPATKSVQQEDSEVDLLLKFGLLNSSEKDDSAQIEEDNYIQKAEEESAEKERLLAQREKEKQQIQQQRLEEQRRLEEQQRLEEQRKLEEQRRLEEKRRLEEQKRLEKQRRIEEQQRLEEQRKLEEQHRIEEQQKLEALEEEQTQSLSFDFEIEEDEEEEEEEEVVSVKDRLKKNVLKEEEEIVTSRRTKARRIMDIQTRDDVETEESFNTTLSDKKSKTIMMESMHADEKEAYIQRKKRKEEEKEAELEIARGRKKANAKTRARRESKRDYNDRKSYEIEQDMTEADKGNESNYDGYYENVLPLDHDQEKKGSIDKKTLLSVFGVIGLFGGIIAACIIFIF